MINVVYFNNVDINLLDINLFYKRRPTALVAMPFALVEAVGSAMHLFEELAISSIHQQTVATSISLAYLNKDLAVVSERPS